MQYRFHLVGALLAALAAVVFLASNATAQIAAHVPGLRGVAQPLPPGLFDPLSRPARPAPSPPLAAGRASAIQRGYGQLPLSFEQNRGQAPASARFLAHGAGYGLALSPTEATFTLLPSCPPAVKIGPPLRRCGPRQTGAPVTLRMRLAGALPHAKIEGREKLPGVVSYFIGKDPSKWRTGVPTFGKVRCSSVYRGIDLVYYGNRRRLEYDFVVAPKADPKQIALRFDGAQRVMVDKTGGLKVVAGGAALRWMRPSVYQNVGGKRQSVQGRFVLRGLDRAGFVVAKYDHARPLVIDPVVYAGYLGRGTPAGIAVDHDGGAYITGSDYQPDFPGGDGRFSDGQPHAFVVRLDPSGSALLYVAYFGGATGSTTASAIAIDDEGNAVIAGQTLASDLPIRNGFQTANSGGTDSFVAKISTTGEGLLYSTYLGGTGSDKPFGVALTPVGNAYVCGSTTSPNFPTMDAYQAALSGPSDAFVTVISTNAIGGPSLLYSTYIGGTGSDGANAIAVDAAGNFYVLGSINIPPVNGYQGSSTDSKVQQITITAFAPDGAGVFYSTFLHSDVQGVTVGPSESVVSMTGNAITVDEQSNVYITGVIHKTVTQGSQVSNGDYRLLARLNCAAAGARSLVFANARGGSPTSSVAGIGIALDSWGNIAVGGTQSNTGKPGDGYATVEKWSADGTRLLYFGSYGEPSSAIPSSFAFDAEASAYAVGAASFGFPVTFGAFRGGGSGGSSFVFKVSTNTPLHFDVTGSDLIFQNDLDGSLAYWLMTGNKETAHGYLTPSNPGPNWKLVGTVDLNGDNSSDLLFQNRESGDLAYWFMRPPNYPNLSTVAVEVGYITPRNPGANWIVVGMADFNRDGFADILFQNSVTGQLYVWFMHGATLLYGAFINPADPGPDWNVAAVGDLNHDGQADILFQNAESGDLYVWYMYGNLLSSGRFLIPSNPGPGWRAVGLSLLATDPSGGSDTTPNILFQNADTGGLAYWIMQGSHLINNGIPQPSDPGANWQLVGPK